MDCPINDVSWYEAAKYCRWLSEQEKVPEDQMCFPSIDQIGVDMQLPNDYLSRTGYRLPTESEWEYACRAGVETERSFGQTEVLLHRYAWTIQNSRVDGQHRLSPVARLRPNDLGLYDMLGNVMEWCITVDGKYPQRSIETVTDDDEGSLVIDAKTFRPVRGGAFLYQSSNARAGHRDNGRPPTLRSFAPYVGFRLARTVQ